jgi:hypothetical protein
MLDLLAYSGYSFVLYSAWNSYLLLILCRITANVLLGNIFGSFVYYISWLLASLFMATFIVWPACSRVLTASRFAPCGC